MYSKRVLHKGALVISKVLPRNLTYRLIGFGFTKETTNTKSEDS